MDLNIDKKQFCKSIDSLSRVDRLSVALALCEASHTRITNQLIPGALRREIAQVRSRIQLKKRASTWNMWKLWVFVMKPIGDLHNWRMTAKQCYRLQPSSSAGAVSRPRIDQKRSRRATIRDCNGHAVPRRWLDRFAPHVRTQADWDQGHP